MPAPEVPHGVSALADVRRYDSAVVARGRRDGQAPPIAIQPHDLELIDAVRRYTFLTTPQLAELFWPEASVQAARMRLVALFRAGFLDRFRPLAERGSFPWTYQLGPEGHRLLQRAGILPLRGRFESREVFDYRYVLHEIQVNSWVLAWRRRLGPRLLSWKGEVQIAPPDDLDRGGDRRTEDGRSVQGLKDALPRAVRPDAVIEVSSKDAGSVHTFLIEYDRTRRVDKNYDKFRRYDNFLCWWCKGAMGINELPWVLFVCQEDVDRERFVAGADVDLAGYLWSGGAGREADAFIGRRRMLFTTAAEMYEKGEVVGNRVPRLPKGRRDAGRHDEGGPVAIPTDPA